MEWFYFGFGYVRMVEVGGEVNSLVLIEDFILLVGMLNEFGLVLVWCLL